MRRLADSESPVPEDRDREGDRGFWSKVKEAFRA
jgi:hypothetical protein